MKNPYEKNKMIALEAFIRRASIVNAPFMLKGSYVTRQYFSNPNHRIPADIDWVYLEKLHDENTSREIFNKWATNITELEINDGVTFRSFKENEFWRRIDYAMADDFPTVNTDLTCWVGQNELVLNLDISFNLEIEQAPVPLKYQPVQGSSFTIPYTVPLSLQVSWKIHQTLVRPRFKDLFDLMYLVQHPSFDKEMLNASVKALLNECKADNVDLSALKYFLEYNIPALFHHNSINTTWNYWRHGKDSHDYGSILTFEKAENITDASKLPAKLSFFLAQFKAILQKHGWTADLIQEWNIPISKEVSNSVENTDEQQEFKFWKWLQNIFR